MLRSSDPPFVFDNDCLSSFLWVKRTDLLVSLFPGQILVPEPVSEELSYFKKTRFSWVFFDFQQQVQMGLIKVVPIVIGDPVAEEYMLLISGKKGKALGKGEAAVLAWVRYNGGTVASNNLADVAQYCRVHNLPLITTEDILCIANLKGLIDVQEGAGIWNGMKACRRKLPDYSFAEALKRFLQYRR